MKVKEFEKLEESEKSNVEYILRAIYNDRVYFVSTDTTFKFLVVCDGTLLDYTYLLISLGILPTSRKSNLLSRQHKYCPYQQSGNYLQTIVNSYAKYFSYLDFSGRDYSAKTPNILWL